MWNFADPLVFLMLPLPLILRLLRRGDAGGGAALTVPGGIAEAFGAAPSARRSALHGIALPGFVWLALVTALAGPRQVLPNLAAPTTGREIVLALDVSGSMVRRDFSLDGQTARRIDAVKRVAAEFLRGRGGDRLALILFGSRAYFATPQTYDAEAVAQAVEGAVIGISGRATGIGDAIGLALKRLDRSEASEKVVLLLSDGSNNAGPVRPLDAAKLAARKGVRIHTIGMGPNEAGDGSGVRDAVDTGTLRGIARLTGGTFFRVRTTGDLVTVTRTIDRLEADDREGPAAELYRERWIWPALAALIGLLAILATRLRTA